MRKFDSDVPKFPCWETEDGTCYNHLCKFEMCRYYGTNDSCFEAPHFCPAFQNCSSCLNGDCPNFLPPL